MLEVRRRIDDEIGSLEERVGIAEAFQFVREWAYVLLIGAILGGSVGAVYAALAQPTYVASVRLLLERPRSVSPAGDPGLVQFTLDTSQIESQIQVILSESTTRRVVREMGLQSDPEFTQSRSSWFQTMTAPARAIIEDKAPAPRESPFGALVREGEPHVQPAVDRMDYVLGVINTRLGARRIGQSYAIEITFWSHYADKASRIANSVAAAYIGNQLELRAASAENGAELIARKLEDLRSQVAATQKAVRSGVIDVHAFPAADVRVITAASPPLGKSWPRTNLMIALGALIGFLSALLLSFMFQKRRSHSRSGYA